MAQDMQTAQKRGASHTSGAPHQDGGPSFFPKGIVTCSESALLGSV